MILVLASALDTAAAAFVRRELRGEALLMIPADLSTPHWCFEWNGPQGHRGQASGVPFASSQLRAVLSLLPAVTVIELPHIVAEDRDYVAAEMHAMLGFWLRELRC